LAEPISSYTRSGVADKPMRFVICSGNFFNGPEAPRLCASSAIKTNESRPFKDDRNDWKCLSMKVA